MQVNEVAGSLIDRSGKTGEGLSLEMGKSKSWASVIRSPKRIPRLDTVADIADAAGVDVVLVDRATGERVGIVDPPRRARPDLGEG